MMTITVDPKKVHENIDFIMKDELDFAAREGVQAPGLTQTWGYLKALATFGLITDEEYHDYGTTFIDKLKEVNQFDQHYLKW